MHNWWPFSPSGMCYMGEAILPLPTGLVAKMLSWQGEGLVVKGRGRGVEGVSGRGRRFLTTFAPTTVTSPTTSPHPQVTYRVVQVSDGQLEGPSDGPGAVSVVSSAAFSGAQQAVAQAVIQNPFSNGGSPSTDTVGGEARFTYFPASAVGDGATAVVSAQGDPSLGQGGGQFYVMMTPQDVLQTGAQRTIAPRTHPYSPKEDPELSNMKIDGPRTPRDERRRAQHNEVERRRRDKINNWIVQLSKIIPDCNADNTKTGQSKGGILSKACDYIRELRQSNQRMQESFKETERLQMDNEMLRQQIDDLKNENTLLRAQLQQHGIELVTEVSPQ
ncbi:upstream stimulatory factor 2-like [Narcine bancroftii]|uniref:upstream stimulatory factor 2-like n=1 Tax=Narcine bancroftii TaxID=1343680 RepID=UPI00383221D2